VAYVFKGADGLEGKLSVEKDQQDATITGPDSSSFGFPLVVAELNGDEIDDMAFGAQLESSAPLEKQGAVHVIYGSEDVEGDINADEFASITITGSFTGELFPSALGASDIDGDGMAELIAGSSLAGSDERPGAGVAHVFTTIGSGSSTLDLSKTAAPITVLGASADDRLGGAVAGGLLDDDKPGLLLLAAHADGGNGSEESGVVYVVSVSR
jgi:hypothetical protein